ncbi:MAG: Dam family site-specific DNA-(adenine-N6)-methyltransferase [Clostridia bacterium]
MKPIRSPFFYVGDKYKLVPQLKDELPKYINKLYEPFCGGGSVFLNVEAEEYHLNDIDINMIRLHKFLNSYKDNEEQFFLEIKNNIEEYGLSASYYGKVVPEQLKKDYVKTYYAKYNKIAYMKLRADYNNNKDNTILLYLLLIYGFNHMIRFNSVGNFNLPVGNVDFNNNVNNALKAYFKAAREKKVKFYNLDFEEFMDKFEFTIDDVVYLDPPYLITFSEYNKFWNSKEEERLLNSLDGLSKKNVKFAISNMVFQKGKYNAIFNYWAQKYSIVNINSNYISYHDNTVKNSIEVLVKNY